METYGKLNPLKKLCLEVKSVFRINEHSERAFKQKGLSCYVPKVGKRFWIAVGVSVVLVSPMIPMGFLGSPFVLAWGLR